MASLQTVQSLSNRSLVGHPSARTQLSTPVLILDLDVFEDNLRRMAGFLAAERCHLRPHAKAHKSGDVGRRQIAAGAIGISCATLQEAEAMAAAGCRSILITSPVVNVSAIARLTALNDSVADLIVVIDDPQNAEVQASAARAAGKPLSFLVDCDVGQNRTGVVHPDDVLDLARSATGELRFRGIQAYYGHCQHVVEYEDRLEVTAQPRQMIREIVERLTASGLLPEIVSGGGTGTHHIDVRDGVFTEIQPGSYPFMDSQYDEVCLWPDDPHPFGNALFVQGTVVSVNRPDYVVVDCGWKAFSTESKPPEPLEPGWTYHFMGDEHGGVAFGNSGRPRLGQCIEFKPPHCDPTVNLFSAFHCVRGETLVDVWPINARGY